MAEIKVPEAFKNYIGSFAGCMGGNPAAPIWLCTEHAFRIPDIVTTEFFDAPVTSIDGLLKGLSCSCPVSKEIAGLVNDIVGQPTEDIDKVFNEKDPSAQAMLALVVSPFSFGDNPTKNWTDEKVIDVNGIKESFAQYTGIVNYKDYWAFCLEERSKLYSLAVRKHAPKVVICEGILKYQDYFKLWGADLTNVRAHDAFYYAPVVGDDGKAISLVFATDVFGTKGGITDPAHIERIALQIRHYVEAELGKDLFGKFAGPRY